MLKGLGITIFLAAFSSQAWSQAADRPQMKPKGEDPGIILAVATSLIEATATVAVGAVLSGVAVGGAVDAINDSKVQAAIGDVSRIGQGILAFYRDNRFFPVFKDGSKTGAGDAFFLHLVSENGAYPADGTPGRYWGTPPSPTVWAQAPFFGHQPRALHDTIEGQLLKNQLGGVTSSLRYPLRGSYTGDPQRGWAGPYVASLPKTDPWGNKYLINVRELQSAHLQDPAFAAVHGMRPGALPQIAVIVLSAGANRTIDTNGEQQSGTFTVTGDDIVFRVK